MALKLIFFAFIFNTKLFAQPVNYQSLYTNATFSKTIDQNKPFGAIEGRAEVTLSGGGTYTIPIKVPPGTNGTESKSGIQPYNGNVDLSTWEPLAAFGNGVVAGFVGGITFGASLAATGLTTGVMAGTVSGATAGAVNGAAVGMFLGGNYNGIGRVP